MLKTKSKNVSVFYSKLDTIGGHCPTASSKNQDIKKAKNIEQHKNIDEEILTEISGDKSDMTKIFIENNKEYFSDKDEKEFILKYADKFTTEIVNEIVKNKKNNSFLDGIKDEQRKKIYDAIKYNILENSALNLNDKNFIAKYKTNTLTETDVKYKVSFKWIKKNIENIFELNEDNVNNILTDLYNNVSYSDNDMINHKQFIENTNDIKDKNKHFLFTNLKGLTSWVEGDIVDYSKGISQKYANEFYSYIDSENFPLEDSSLKTQLSPDEVVALTMMFSGREKEVEQIEGANLTKFLEKIGSKFKYNSKDIGDIKDIYSLKKAVISAAFPQQYIGLDSDSYKAFLNMTKYSKFSDISNICYTILKAEKNKENNKNNIKSRVAGNTSNSINSKSTKTILSKKYQTIDSKIYKKKVNNFFNQNIDKSKDSNEFLKNFNEVFGKFGITEGKENVKAVKEEKELKIASRLRGINDKNVESDIKKFISPKNLSKLGINEKNRTGEKFEETMQKIFDSKNINKLLHAYNNSKINDPIVFLESYLKKQGIYDFMKNNTTINGKKNNKDKNYYNFVRELFYILVGDVKIKDLKLSYNIANSNKNFTNFIDKQFKVISDEKLLKIDKKNKDLKINKDNLKKGLEVNLELSLVEFMTEKGSYKIDKAFLQANKIELLSKFEKDNKSFNWDKKKTIPLFTNFIDNFPGDKVFKFDKDKVNELKNKLEKNKKFIEEADKIDKLGYNNYVEQNEKEKNEKIFLEKTGGMYKENIPFENSVFAGKNPQETAVYSKYKDGICEFQLKLPGKKNVIKISSLTWKKGNNELTSEYLKNLFGIDIKLKGNADALNKIVSHGTNIAEEGLQTQDFNHMNSFFQTYIYEKFFKNNQDKKLAKKYHLNPYDMYMKPQEFAKQFAKMLNEIYNTSIAGMKFNGGKFVLDIQEIKNTKIFNENHQKRIKKEIMDKGRNYYKTENGLLGNIYDNVSSLFKS